MSLYAGYYQNFNKMSSDVVETFDLPYDYESLMHYPKNAFAKPNTNVTIVSRVSILVGWFIRIIDENHLFLIDRLIQIKGSARITDPHSMTWRKSEKCTIVSVV